MLGESYRLVAALSGVALLIGTVVGVVSGHVASAVLKNGNSFGRIATDAVLGCLGLVATAYGIDAVQRWSSQGLGVAVLGGSLLPVLFEVVIWFKSASASR